MRDKLIALPVGIVYRRKVGAMIKEISEIVELLKISKRYLPRAAQDGLDELLDYVDELQADDARNQRKLAEKDKEIAEMFQAAQHWQGAASYEVYKNMKLEEENLELSTLPCDCEPADPTHSAKLPTWTAATSD